MSEEKDCISRENEISELKENIAQENPVETKDKPQEKMESQERAGETELIKDESIKTDENKEPKEFAEPGENKPLDEPGKDLVESEIERSTSYEQLKIDNAFLDVNKRLDALNKQMEKLEAEFMGKIRYDQRKDKIIDDLHREVQEYKNDLLKNLTRPIIMDIIHAIDDIGKLVENHQAKDPSELDPMKLVRQMAGIAADLEDILFRQGVESFTSHQPAYDPKRQKIIKTEITEDPTLDKTISKRVHNGYEWEDKVLRQEMVNVFIFKPGTKEQEVSKENEINKSEIPTDNPEVG